MRVGPRAEDSPGRGGGDPNLVESSSMAGNPDRVYERISLNEAVEALRAGQGLNCVEIEDLRALIETTQHEIPDLEEIYCLECKILKCDCEGLECAVALFLEDSEFVEKASFWHASFAKGASFRGATFSKAAYFGGATFSEEADFGDVTFSKVAYFVEATFSKAAYFDSATFSEVAAFRGATFSPKGVYFGRATFSGLASFLGAMLYGMINLQLAKFSRPCSLNLAGLRLMPGGGVRLSMDQIGRYQRPKWLRKRLLNTCLFVLHLVSLVLDGDGQHWWRKGRNWWKGARGLMRPYRYLRKRWPSVHLLEWETSARPWELADAAAQYNILRDSFRTQPSTDDEEDRCHYKYKDLTRRVTKGRRLWRACDWAVMKWCLGYGIYTKRILATAVGVILAFAGLYHAVAGPETIDHFDEGPFGSIYFSIITFTTLGYGDYQPLGWLRYAAGLEALLGLTLVAVFTVSYARKLIR